MVAKHYLPAKDVSPIPNAVRSVFYDSDGQHFYTEWQLLDTDRAASQIVTGKSAVTAGASAPAGPAVSTATVR